ncbi:2-phosphosulfolactate phosphatase [Peribacillus frigoritolerans]|uniref:2-phosphosulfolactate phosphatase n=1 Tax=Peribacillus frigoritolerans TaxID=450367 RepID=UPI00380D189D
MRKIHVLTRKEDIDPSKLTHCTAVIIDILLATTTIAATLYHGARELIPVMNQEEALELSVTLSDESYLLAGEKDGYPLAGFINPNPLELIKADLAGKTLILCTTNGTVAIKKSMTAKRVYTSSFPNGAEVAKQIRKDNDDSSVVIVCAGSKGNFSIEDFLGAGYLISELVRNGQQGWSLSDSAQAAVQLYQHQSQQIEQSLWNSATGTLLKNLGYSEVFPFVAKQGLLPVVPNLINDSIVNSK